MGVSSQYRIIDGLVGVYLHLCFRGKSITKAIAWHSQVAKLAVAYSNHSVHIYSKVSPVTPILKHRSQQHVSCLRWQ